MTFIAADGVRTVTNCTVHDARKVYEITTSALLEICRSGPGTGEVERTGKQAAEQRVYHVLARTAEDARTYFDRRWAFAFRAPHTLISIKPLFVIDGEINLENS